MCGNQPNAFIFNMLITALTTTGIQIDVYIVGLFNLMCIRNNQKPLRSRGAYRRQYSGPPLVHIIMGGRLFGANPSSAPILLYLHVDPWGQITVRYAFFIISSAKCLDLSVLMCSWTYLVRVTGRCRMAGFVDVCG